MLLSEDFKGNLSLLRGTQEENLKHLNTWNFIFYFFRLLQSFISVSKYKFLSCLAFLDEIVRK